MLIETWAEVLSQSFQNLWFGIIGFLPNIVVAIVILLIGWLIGAGLSKVVEQVVESLKINNALRSAGVEDALTKGGFTLDAGKFLGGLVKWFVILVFLVASLEVLNLTQVTIFLQEVVLLYLPRIIVAVLILLAAAVIAEVVQNIVSGAAKAAEIPSASFLSKITKWAIWIIAILAALDQLNVASVFVQTLFTGMVVAISLALGLAFGLGGQEAASRYLEHLEKEVSERRNKK
jgi:small-conductance mechanosensitive channel